MRPVQPHISACIVNRPARAIYRSAIFPRSAARPAPDRRAPRRALAVYQRLYHRRRRDPGNIRHYRDSLIPAVSSVFSYRWISEARA